MFIYFPPTPLFTLFFPPDYHKHKGCLQTVHYLEFDASKQFDSLHRLKAREVICTRACISLVWKSTNLLVSNLQHYLLLTRVLMPPQSGFKTNEKFNSLWVSICTAGGEGSAARPKTWHFCVVGKRIKMPLTENCNLSLKNPLRKLAFSACLRLIENNFLPSASFVRFGNLKTLWLKTWKKKKDVYECVQPRAFHLPFFSEKSTASTVRLPLDLADRHEILHEMHKQTWHYGDQHQRFLLHAALLYIMFWTMA